MMQKGQRIRRRTVLLSLAAVLTAGVLSLLPRDDLVGVAPGEPPSLAGGSEPTANEAAMVREPGNSGDRALVGASVAGRTLRRDGHALVGVDVLAADGTVTRSGPDGRYVFSGLSHGVHTLHAEADGLTSAPSGAIVVRGGETIEGIDLVLEPACYVSGRVTAGPMALPGARVSGRLRDASAFPDLPPGALLEPTRLTVATDSDGRFRLGPFAPGRIELAVEHEDHLPFARLYPSDAQDVQVSLPMANWITGVVLEPDGQRPAVLERVLLLVANPGRPEWTIVGSMTPEPADAESGRFRVRVPGPQAVVVAAVMRDFAITRSALIRITPRVPSPRIELRAAAGSWLAGTVHDATGPAVAGAEISLRQDGLGGEIAHLASDADGKFRVVLAPGRYTARIRKAGYAAHQLQVEVVADQPVAALDVPLVRGGALRGRILAAEGAALPALEVFARRVDDAKAPSATAMVGDGTYAFDFLLPGDYQVVLRERGVKTSCNDGVAVHVGMGESAELDLSPGTSGLSRLRGDVTRNGAVVPFVTVNLLRGGGPKLATATADRFGHFEFDAVAAGSLTLTVTHGVAGPVMMGRTLELGAAEIRDEVLSVAYGSLSGRVLAAGDQAPLREIRVDVLSSDGRTLATTRTDPDGRFTLPVVQAGNWYVGFGRLGEPVAKRQAMQVVAGQLAQMPVVEM